MQSNCCKADVTVCIFAHNSRSLYACIPGPAECDFDVSKNVLRSILRLRATSGVIYFNFFSFFSFLFSIKFYALAKDIQIANANTECIP